MRTVTITLRSLLRRPGFALTTMLTLGLGIGSATLVIATMNALHYRLLTCPEPDRLVIVAQKNERFGPGWQVSYPNFCDGRAQNHVFEEMAIIDSGRVNIHATGEPRRVGGCRVSAGYFAVQRVRPILGRDFREEDCVPAAAPVVIISHGLWQSEFAGQEKVIGTVVSLDAQPHTIIGVMPLGYRFLPTGADGPQVWRPLTMDRQLGRGDQWMQVIARLKPGVTREQAQTEMSVIAARLAKEYPEANAGWGAIVRPLGELVAQLERETIPLLAAAVAGVLFICFANAAGLVVGRAAERLKEAAVRTALGANGWEMMRYWGAESLLLAAGSTGVGLGFAAGGMRMINWFLARNNLLIPELVVDWRVVMAGIGLAGLVAFVLNWVLVRGWRGLDVGQALREDSRTASSSLKLQRFGYGLTVSQVALSTALLIISGLLFKSVIQLASVSPGFKPEGIWTAEIALPENRYKTPDQQTAFCRDALDRVQAQPGVEQAALASNLPMLDANMYTEFTLPGRTGPAEGNDRRVNFTAVTPAYFSVLGVPLLQGRGFTQDEGTFHPVIVSEALVRRHFKDKNPAGEQISVMGEDRTIVGVVGDVRHDGLRQAGSQQVYVPFQQFPRTRMFVAVKTRMSEAAILPLLRRVVSQIDPEQPLSQVRPMEAVVNASLSPERLILYLVCGFGGLSFVLTLVGVYAVLNYWVKRRSREIGIRMALGATVADIYRLVLSQGGRLVILGLVLGLGLARAGSRLVTSQLFQVRAFDETLYLAIAGSLGVAAIMACLWPARLAVRTEPVVVLRQE